MSELKPCPFCGHKHPSLERQGWNIPAEGDGYQWVDMFKVVCVQCVAQTFSYRAEELAIEAWNRRASDERV